MPEVQDRRGVESKLRDSNTIQRQASSRFRKSKGEVQHVQLVILRLIKDIVVLLVLGRNCIIWLRATQGTQGDSLTRKMQLTITTT